MSDKTLSFVNLSLKKISSIWWSWGGSNPWPLECHSSGSTFTLYFNWTCGDARCVLCQ